MQNAVALQLDTCLSICSTIEALLLDSLGPNGLHTMLTTSSGNALISGDGHTVVTSLMLSHPIARWVVDHMKSHHGMTGDNAKSFILLLMQILRHILHKEGCSVTNLNRSILTELSNGLAELGSAILPDVVLPELIKHAVVTVVSEQNRQVVKTTCLNIIQTTFAGKFNPQAINHISKLLCGCVLEFCPELAQLDKSILYLLDHFEEVFLEVTNEPVMSSRISKGIIVSRDFIHKADELDSLPNVKFILVGHSFESYTPESTSTLNISSLSQMQHVLNYKITHIQSFIRHVETKGVNLIISAELVSDATLHECRQSGISVIHMVPEEEISHIAHHASVQILHGPDDIINESTIGIADYCDSLRMGNSKCVKLGVATRQLVICAPTKGMCRQWYTAVHNALKCLRMWLDHDQQPCLDDPSVSVKPGLSDDEQSVSAKPGLQDELQLHCTVAPCKHTSETATADPAQAHITNLVDPNSVQQLCIAGDVTSENPHHTATGGSTKKALVMNKLAPDHHNDINFVDPIDPAIFQELCITDSASESKPQIATTEVPEIINTVPVDHHNHLQELCTTKVDAPTEISTLTQKVPKMNTIIPVNHNHLQGLSITGGGAADILMSKILSEHSVRPSTSLAASKACKIVSESLLCIPRTLHSNSFIPKSAKTSFIHVQHQMEKLCTTGRLFGVDGRTGVAGDLGAQGVVEPVMAKYLLVSDVVRTVHELLRIDTVIGVRGLVKELNQDNV